MWEGRPLIAILLKTVGRGRCEPDAHTWYPNMTHVASHDIPNLYNRWLLHWLGDIGLQRESSKMDKANGLVKTGIGSLSTRPNHPGIGEENNTMQTYREIRECDCWEGRCNTCCPHKKDTPTTREPFYPSEGNMQNINGRVNKNLDGLPMSLGQVQHEQIEQQCPTAIVENDHPCYNRDQEQCTQQKSEGHAKARFTGIADIINSEFQGYYEPLDTD